MAVMNDLRMAVRQWFRHYGIAAVASLTLALGVGGATTMYSFLQAVAQYSQPTVPQAEQVARLFTTLVRESDGRGMVNRDDYWPTIGSRQRTFRPPY